MKLFACKNFVGASTVDYTDHGADSSQELSALRQAAGLIIRFGSIVIR